MVMCATWRRKIPIRCTEPFVLNVFIFTLIVLNFFVFSVSYDFVEMLKVMSHSDFEFRCFISIFRIQTFDIAFRDFLKITIFVTLGGKF